jgi:hypothetical protein
MTIESWSHFYSRHNKQNLLHAESLFLSFTSLVLFSTQVATEPSSAQWIYATDDVCSVKDKFNLLASAYGGFARDERWWRALQPRRDTLQLIARFIKKRKRRSTRNVKFSVVQNKYRLSSLRTMLRSGALACMRNISYARRPYLVAKYLSDEVQE